MILKFFFLFFLFFYFVFSQSIDETLIPYKIGPDVVEASLEKLEKACIFKNDFLFSRKVAMVESGDGMEKKTFRPDFYGGIWQVEFKNYQITKKAKRKILEKIKNKFGIDWEKTEWKDLVKPFFSALAFQIYNNLTLDTKPPVLEIDQARVWKNLHDYYFSKTEFFEKSKDLKKNCYEGKVDVAFIIDSSRSTGYLNFKITKDFIKKLIKKLKIGPVSLSDSLFSFLSFNSKPNLEFDFQKFSTQEEYEKAVDEIPYYNKGVKNIGEALRFLNDEIFIPQRGARNNVPRIAILITNGKSINKTNTLFQASRLHNSSIIPFVVGVGPRVDKEELKSISGSPTCSHLHLIDYFQELFALVDLIERRVCNASIIINNNSTINIGNKEKKKFEFQVKGYCQLEMHANEDLEIYFGKNFNPSLERFDGKEKLEKGKTKYYSMKNFSNDDVINLFIVSNKKTDLEIVFLKKCSRPCDEITCPPGSMCINLPNFTSFCRETTTIFPIQETTKNNNNGITTTQPTKQTTNYDYQMTTWRENINISTTNNMESDTTTTKIPYKTTTTEFETTKTPYKTTTKTPYKTTITTKTPYKTTITTTTPYKTTTTESEITKTTEITTKTPYKTTTTTTTEYKTTITTTPYKTTTTESETTKTSYKTTTTTPYKTTITTKTPYKTTTTEFETTTITTETTKTPYKTTKTTEFKTTTTTTTEIKTTNTTPYKTTTQTDSTTKSITTTSKEPITTKSTTITMTTSTKSPTTTMVTEVTMTTDSREFYNCEERNPCTKENADEGKFYFTHSDPHLFVQCSQWGQCYIQKCPLGLSWNQEILTCM